MAIVCRILQLSDLHYGEIAKKKDFKHRFKKYNNITSTDEDTEELVQKCSKAVKQYASDDIPLFIVITGDLVCQGGVREQYETAYKNISLLMSSLNVTCDKIIIVPGNHDVDRPSEGRSPLKDYIQEVHNKIFATMPSRKLPIEFGSDGKFDKEGGDWVHIVNIQNAKPDGMDNKKIAFITFYSPIVTPKYLINPYVPEQDIDKKKRIITNFCKVLGEKGVDKWAFDRGLITDDQWKAVKDALDRLEANNNFLKIAICHHNPLPIRRYYKDPVHNTHTKTDDFPYPELNLLSNGSEIMPLLAENGVSLLLHGHRHQDAIATSFPWQRLVIVGTPSAGLCNEALALRLDRKVHVPHEWQGFNLIDIYNTEVGFSILVNTFNYHEDEKSYQLEKLKQGLSLQNKTKIPLHLEPNFPFHPLSDSEGVESAVRHIVQSKGGTTSLHYTDEANWDDGTKSAEAIRDSFDIKLSAPYTPVRRCFDVIINNLQVAFGFTKYLKHGAPPEDS